MTNNAWLLGKKIIRRDDLYSPLDLEYAPRLKANILTRFIKKNNFENGDSIHSYLDGVVHLTPLEYNFHCKVLALKWVLENKRPTCEDDLEHLDYFRINHFFDRRLGVSLWLTDLFPAFTPYTHLREIEIEKEGLDSQTASEFFREIRPFYNLAMDEVGELKRKGLISAVLKWQGAERDRLFTQVVDCPSRACTSCRRDDWRLMLRKFGVYRRCNTRNCRGVQEVRRKTGNICLVCNKPVYEMLGVGGKRVYVCSAYPVCDYASVL